MRQKSPTLLLALLLFVAAGCSPSRYPRQLAEADSLLFDGSKAQMDSVLADYRAQHRTPGEAERMYYRLLCTGAATKDQQAPAPDLLQLDSLARYYAHHGTRRQHALALQFVGLAHRKLGNDLAATDAYLAADDEAAQSGDTRLRALIARAEGYAYFSMALPQQAAEAFRRYYAFASQRADSLCLADAALCMGTTFTTETDSMARYYLQAIALAGDHPRGRQIVRDARFNLVNAYLERGDTRQARTYLTDDSLSVRLWADWYYALGQPDSAARYYERSLYVPTGSDYVRSYILRMLANIALDRHDLPAALDYSMQLVAFEDSVKEQQLAAETRKIKVNHEYTQARMEQQRMAHRRTLAACAVVVLLAVGLLLLAYGYALWGLRRQRYVAALAQEQMLRREAEEKSRQSDELIEANRQKMDELERLLREALRRNDAQEAQKLERDATALAAETRRIETRQSRRKRLIEDMKDFGSYRNVKLNAGKPGFQLSDADWATLAADIDATYDNFSTRLRQYTDFTRQEMQLCYLTKIDVSPTDIAILQNTTTAAVSMMRQRMYRRMFPEQGGGSKEFEDFILSF